MFALCKALGIHRNKDCQSLEFDISDEYGWWFSRKDEDDLSFSALETSEIDDGHQASVELIKQTFQEQVLFQSLAFLYN